MGNFLEVSLIAMILLIILNLWRSAQVKRHKIIVERDELMLKKYEINAKTTIDPILFVVLDKFISDVLSDYTFLNIEGGDEIVYLNSEKREELRRNVAYLVMEQISPELWERLTILYRGEKLSDVIAKKVTIQVLAYVMHKNRIRTDEEVENERKERINFLLKQK